MCLFTEMRLQAQVKCFYMLCHIHEVFGDSAFPCTLSRMLIIQVT